MKIWVLTNKKPTPNTHGEQCLELVKENYLVEVDIDEVYDTYNQKCDNNHCEPLDQRSCVECKIGNMKFSEFLQERMK